MHSNQPYIIEFLLWTPSVYSGLDHLMVDICKMAKKDNRQVVCVYCDTMQGMPMLERDIVAAGGKVELVSSNRRLMLRDIRAIYRKYRPEVVNTHFVHPAKLYTQWLSMRYHARHFTHVHSLLGDVQRFRKQKGILKRFAVGVYYWMQKKMSRQVFCVSEVAKEQYRMWGLGACRNVQILHLGTPLKTPAYTQVQAREMLCLPIDKCIITNVSAVEPIKGIDLIINALALLKQQGKEILFVHIGGLRSDTQEQRQYADSLKQMAKDLNVDQQIIWLGRRNDVQDILPLADIYVHPSRSEAFGSVLMEAAVAGLPLIGTRVGGIPEIVQNGMTGILIPPDDSDVLAVAIADIMDHPSIPYGSQARDFVSAHFNQSACAQQLYRTYYE